MSWISQNKEEPTFFRLQEGNLGKGGGRGGRRRRGLNEERKRRLQERVQRKSNRCGSIWRGRISRWRLAFVFFVYVSLS
jgi:hypothetical protein